MGSVMIPRESSPESSQNALTTDVPSASRKPTVKGGRKVYLEDGSNVG